MLLKLSWFRNNKMKWMLSKRNWKQILMKDSSWGKVNITSYFRDIKMSRKKLKINRILKELSLKESSLVKKQVQKGECRAQLGKVWWPPEWEPLKWEEETKWQLGTQLRNHHIWSETDRYANASHIHDTNHYSRYTLQ